MNLRLAATCTHRHELTLRRRWRCLSTRAFEVEGELTKLPRGELPRIGVEASVTHVFTLEDTTRFALLNGDNNPIHTDAEFARREAGVTAPIVQGMLSSSLFATIFGRTIPGAVYVSQAFRWRAPLLVNEEVRARIRVIKLRKRFVDCETICEKTEDGTVVVEGQATVLLPSPVSATKEI